MNRPGSVRQLFDLYHDHEEVSKFTYKSGGFCTIDSNDMYEIYIYICSLEEENKQLKEEIKELELIIGLRQKRNLIKKFYKEFDSEDKKKNPNRDYVAIRPDAEEVYKRYYQLKDRINKAIDYIKINYCNREDINDCWHSGVSELLEILKGDFKCMK